MNTKHLNGTIFERMVRNGLANLRLHEKEVNDMNVFPVPDGDTGINMRLTLENGVQSAPSQTDLAGYLRALSSGMLLGARGNSGVILSQVFRGIAHSLSRCSIANVNEMMQALTAGYQTAYKAVIHPVEGTILTVTREGVEGIRSQISRGITFEALFSIYVAQMRKSLASTPDILPTLKDAGVVDSGAMGYIYIAEGMAKALYGDIIQESESVLPPAAPKSNPDSASFNGDSEFVFGYCMEFILQLMNSNEYARHFKLKNYIDDLSHCGDSIVALQDESRVKVHIHTKKPARIITLSQEYGEFVTFKLDNMQLQHNERYSANKPVIKKDVAIVAVANGDGIKNVLTDLGCDIIIDGGATMNTSSQEFVDAFRQFDAGHIIVLPNNKNVHRAALQGVSLSGKTNVTVLPTVGIADAYFALAMDVADEPDVQKRLAKMQAGIDATTAISLAKATKEYTANGLSCSAGDYIGLKNGEMVACGKDFALVLSDALETVPSISEKESTVVFIGSEATDELSDILNNIFEEKFPDIEVCPVESGQSIYSFVIGL